MRARTDSSIDLQVSSCSQWLDMVSASKTRLHEHPASDTLVQVVSIAGNVAPSLVSIPPNNLERPEPSLFEGRS